MKVIFLDIDGPLLSHRALRMPENQLEWAHRMVPPLPEPIEQPLVGVPDGAERIRRFDPCAVALLNSLHEGHQARLVISSSWQKAGRLNVEFILTENGINPAALHHHWRTDCRTAGATRAEQIRHWLDRASDRGEHIDAYAAIDDDPSILSLPGGIRVPYADGLRWSDYCSASAALGGGFVLSEVDISSGSLVAMATPGALGESVVQRHGGRPRRFDFGRVDPDRGTAPDGCFRLIENDYQLVRYQPAG